MHAAADRLAPALEAADRDKPGYTEFLHEMLTAEVTALAERRLAGRLRFAKLPELLATIDPDRTVATAGGCRV